MYVITNMYGCEKGHLVQAKRMKKWSMTLFRSLLSATVPISMNVKKKKLKQPHYRPGVAQRVRGS